uniref:Protein-tyrosine phosphatase n=1 Tax=Parascaris univalens TaxID=6257 RepID=A0A915AQE3_PARUN
ICAEASNGCVRIIPLAHNIGDSAVKMGPKPKRRVMTRAQCSVEIEGRGNSTKKGGRKKVTMDARTQMRRMAAAEPRVPIGKKFVHKRSSESSSSAHRSSSPIEQWICSIAELGVRGIRKEFVHAVKGFVPAGAQSAWEDDKNFEKNRYEDIRLLDKTRVIIKKSPDSM